MSFACRITPHLVDSGLGVGKRKGPGMHPEPSRSTEAERRLLEGAGNAAERGVQLGAKALDDGDDRDRNAGGDETVFNGRGARLVLHETREKGLHELAP